MRRAPLGLILFCTLVLCWFAIPESAYAEAINLDFGEIKNGSATSHLVQIIGLITILSIAPAIVLMVTSFTRIIVVLSFARTAVGLQQTPPNVVLASLALFLTFFIMAPVFNQAYEQGIAPLMKESIDEATAWNKASEPFHKFMLEHTRDKDLGLFVSVAKLEIKEPKDTPMHVLVPAFMLSELKRAFEIGFLIFLPFVIIDMLVSAILMAMGMVMMPPAILSLPFKLIFFVLVDGWHVLCESLIKSYVS